MKDPITGEFREIRYDADFSMPVMVKDLLTHDKNALKMVATTIEQSNKFLELGLNPESADMHYYIYPKENNRFGLYVGYDPHEALDYVKRDIYDYVPAWSFSALLRLMPERVVINGELSSYLCLKKCSKGYLFAYDGYMRSTTKDTFKLTAIDAAYEMIVWLLENKLI